VARIAQIPQEWCPNESVSANHKDSHSCVGKHLAHQH
jgi:hypothetical protein